MLTIDKLRELGADTEEGVKRCVNNEAFYLDLVKMTVKDDSFEKLRDALENKDLDEAFERAHALKGVLGNVSLTQLFTPVAVMTEELRARNDIDYSGYLNTIFAELEKLRALLD